MTTCLANATGVQQEWPRLEQMLHVCFSSEETRNLLFSVMFSFHTTVQKSVMLTQRICEDMGAFAERG